MKCEIIIGCALEELRKLAAESVHCVVTSPPYYGLRDYGLRPSRWGDGTECCLGLEPTLAAFLAHCVELFREVRRVLRKDGTCWVNMGDSYAGKPGGGQGAGGEMVSRSVAAAREKAVKLFEANGTRKRSRENGSGGLKPKDMMGVPWRLAFALQDDGWWLRQEIIWSKPNPMPESTKDRCTKSHEHLFLLTRSARYHWDADAIREPVTGQAHARGAGANPKAKAPEGWDTSKGDGPHGGVNRKYSGNGVGFGHGHQEGKQRERGRVKQNESFSAAVSGLVDERNKRTVWTIPTYPCKEAHFATYPPDLVKPCVLAGCPLDGTVLDPFLGSGTTAMVALELGRRAIGVELNPEYAAMARRRIDQVTPGLGI